MQSHGRCEEDRERLSAFVFGALSAEERTSVERHLASGCDACRQEVAAFLEVGGLLALAAPAVEAPAALRHRLRGEIRRGRETDGVLLRQPGLLMMRASDMLWQATDFAGIEAKRLFEDPARRYVTALVRMKPGIRYRPTATSISRNSTSWRATSASRASRCVRATTAEPMPGPSTTRGPRRRARSSS